MILDMFVNEPVEKWGPILDTADFPPIRTGMCAMLTTAMTLFFPMEVINKIIELVVLLFKE
jgi:hypothetical protein